MGAVEAWGAVIGRAELPGGSRLLALTARDVARQVQPGQFAMLRCASGWDPYLRRALPFLRAAGDTVSFLFAPTDPGLVWLAGRALGETVSLLGPLGQGFVLEPGTRRLLLAATNGPLAPLLALADLALARDVSVSLVLEAGAASGLATLIPQAVELAVAPPGAVWSAAAGMLAWADQVAVAGPAEELRSLAALCAPLRSAFVQCYLQAPIACGLGWCGSCLAETRRGPRRTCTGGPVFDLRELHG